MPLQPSYSTSQIIGESSKIYFEDDSSGSDGNITGRRIYLQNSSGDFLVQEGTTTEYELWPLADTTISLDVLEKDMGLRSVVEWVDVNGDVLYSLSKIEGFTLYNSTFDYALTQVLAGNPLVINDNNFFKNKSDIRVNIDSGNQAIVFASDILAAQLCYDRATAIRLSSKYYFNLNS